MGNKKEIGKLFENKLSTGKKNPTENLWEKINTSLDEEKRKRKRLLLYWWLGGGISVLLGLVLLFSARTFLNPNSQILLEQDSLEKNSFSNSENENNEKSMNILEDDSLQFESNGEEKLSKIETTSDEPMNNTENTSEKNFERKTQKGSLKAKSIDEIYTVSEKYYYYNSKNGKQMVTTNRKEIDSLVSQQYKSLDSTANRKNDSIK